MKPIHLHPVSTLLGAALTGLALLAAGAQSATKPIAIQPFRCCDGFQPPVPVTKLEYFSVVNYAGLALAGDVVQVAPGERLVVLGQNPSAKGLSSISIASAFKLPAIDQTFAEKLLTYGAGDTTGLLYFQSGVPIAFLDEGSYVFAEHPGVDPTPRQEHARALIGYRVRVEE
ncbi:MAG: hypothetical protein HOP15_18885 [Planctomycetes bacterium]|nr:hypothetical protein [Planctomycetota bacterium]